MRRLREAGEFVTRISVVELKVDRVETSMAERQALSDPVGIRRINLFGRSQTAATPGPFGLQQMALAGVTPHHLAVGGDFKPLCHGFFGLDTFWASHKCRFLKRRRNIG